MSRTSFEISGTGGDQNFPFTDHALTASPAHTAVAVHDHGSGFHKDVDQSFVQRLHINLIGSRRDQESDALMNLLSFQYLSRQTQLIDPPVVAGT